MAKYFDDIAKDQTDLLEKGFPVEGTFKVTAETKASNGLSFKNEITRKIASKKDEKTGLSSRSEEIAAVVEPKFDWKEQNVEFTGKFSTNNNGPYEAGFSAKDLGTNGTKVGLTGVSDRDGWSVKGSASLKNDNVAVKVGAQYPFEDYKPIKADGSLVVHHQNILVGGDVKYELGHQGLDKKNADRKVFVAAKLGYQGVLAYVTKEHQIHGYYQQNIPKGNVQPAILGLRWIHNISSALKFTLNANVCKNNTQGAQGIVGAQYLYDEYTTLRSKFTVKNGDDKDPTEFRVGLAAAQKINSNLSAVVGSDLNLRKVLGGNEGADHSFGFELKFNA